MSTPTMVDRADEYRAYRRALGYRLRVEGPLLLSFARFADESGHRGPLTTEIALRWARLPEHASRLYQARRLELVGTLAKYLVPREPGTEVPPRGLLGSAHARTPAFIYSDADLVALIDAARALTPADGLRPRTYVARIGLLACTGLRSTEALTPGDGDVDLDVGVLTVRQTKYRKSRLVPLHPSAVGPLREYADVRACRHRHLKGAAFFGSDAGRPLPYWTVRSTSQRSLRKAMPTAAPVGRPRPRLHDIRHTFARRRLLARYREGAAIDRAIGGLSAYLGHAKVTDTYWYLAGIPEPWALVGRRFERFAVPPDGDAQWPLPSTAWFRTSSAGD